MTRSKTILRTALSVLVLVLLARYIQVHRGQFVEILAKVSWKIFLAMFVVQMVEGLAHGFRFYVLVHEQGAKIGVLSCLRIFAVSRFLGTFIPHSGLIYRGVALKEEANFQVRDYVGTAIAFSWFSLAMSLVISLSVILIASTNPILIVGLDSRILLGGLLAGCLLGPLACQRGLDALRVKNTRVAGLVKRLQTASRAIFDLIFRPRLLLQFFALSTLSFALVGLALFLAFRNGGHHVGLVGLALLFAGFNISTIVNLTPGNIGLLELILGYIGTTQGFHPSVGVFAMLIVRVVGFFAMLATTILLGGTDAIKHWKPQTEAI